MDLDPCIDLRSVSTRPSKIPSGVQHEDDPAASFVNASEDSRESRD